GVLIVEGAVVLPLAGTEGVMAVLQETAQVLGGAGAAIGDQQEIGGQNQGLSQQLVLLFDARVPLAISVEKKTGQRDSPQIVGHGGEAELKHLVFGEVAAGDVCR